MKNAKISILVNVYNGARTIGRAISSLLAQSYGNIEVIVFDDGSSDDTVEVVRSFNSEKIVLIENKANIGLGNGRNKALQYVSGDILGFCDADDYWHPDFLSCHMDNWYFGLKLQSSNFFIVDYRENIRGLKYACSTEKQYLYTRIINRYTVGLLATLVEVHALRSVVNDLQPKYHCIWDRAVFTEIIRRYGGRYLPFALSYNTVDELCMSVSGRDRLNREIVEWSETVVGSSCGRAFPFYKCYLKARFGDGRRKDSLKAAIGLFLVVAWNIQARLEVLWSMVRRGTSVPKIALASDPETRNGR